VGRPAVSVPTSQVPTRNLATKQPRKKSEAVRLSASSTPVLALRSSLVRWQGSRVPNSRSPTPLARALSAQGTHGFSALLDIGRPEVIQLTLK
jgi:hypothetical protein